MQSAKLHSKSSCLLGMNLSDMIVHYARVSNPASQMRGDNNEGLIRYLLKHKHWSPFEMVNCVVEVTTTRDISHQLIRHRSFSFQEFSQRYSATETNGDVKECRLQDTINRQNSLPNEDAHLASWWDQVQSNTLDRCFGMYDEALKAGVAKEVARVILPEGLTRTKLFVNGSIRSWIHYIDLRTGPETQKEHRELASLMAKEIKLVFPEIEQFDHTGE